MVSRNLSFPVLVISLSIISILFIYLTLFSMPINYQVHLTIDVEGMSIPIPANVGISESGSRGPVYTQNWDNILHFQGFYTPENTRLGKFFDAWGVVFNNRCVFQFCNEEMHMYVNYEENFDFDNYQVHDGDDILITVRMIN